MRPQDIFNTAQHVATTDTALAQIKKLYKITEFKDFEEPFQECVRKLFQAKQTGYSKTTCDFLCKFLQHVSKLSEDVRSKESNKVTLENTAPPTRNSRRNTRSSVGSECSVASTVATGNRRGKRKAAQVDEEDELLSDVLGRSVLTDLSASEDSLVGETTIKKRKSSSRSRMSIGPITDHDRLISSCIDVANDYMQVADDNCRLNAVIFIGKFLKHVTSLDENICSILKSTLAKRIRDRKPMIRAQAVWASGKFQDDKMTKEAFKHHFYRDPELVVRSALLQIMDTKVFGYDFLVYSTRDQSESIRKVAFKRLGNIDPTELNQSQLHHIIHNGLSERERGASYSFRTHTLVKLLELYDGIDLYKLLERFDVINQQEDVRKLLEVIFELNLEELQNNGASTKLHQVAETFRERWLCSDNKCLPLVEAVDEKVVTIWLTLIDFCKEYQVNIKPVRVRLLQQQDEDPNASIEKILDSQDKNEETVELYERLTPDLVNLVSFLKLYVSHADKVMKSKNEKSINLEFVYQQIMEFITTYDIGDDSESNTTKEVFDNILKENLLTSKFSNFIPPIMKCLSKLIYKSNSNQMINYVSEIIQNVRSHLEDLAASTSQLQITVLPTQTAIIAPSPKPLTRSAKKVTIREPKKRKSDFNHQDLEFKIATKRVELEELKDKFDQCIKDKEFDEAKAVDKQISDLKVEVKMLHDRRCSIASDVSHMSMIIETEPTGDSKLSSTMIGDTSLNESNSGGGNHHDSETNKYVFRHHANELLKCFQMYYGCLKCVKISQVPPTMLSHLNHMCYESLTDWFKDDTRVRTLMIACNGLTAFIDKEFANQPNTQLVLWGACHDSRLEVKTAGFISVVDLVCEHDDVIFEDFDKVELFLKHSFKDYDKYTSAELKKNEIDFIIALVEGTSKLYYFEKLSSPQILAHLIIWWYHPHTHSRSKQFIGVFLPTFVEHASKKHRPEDDNWLEELLGETFVTSIEFLHAYSRIPTGYEIMTASDMQSLISFLCNWVPVSLHPSVMLKVDEKIDDLAGNTDLLKFMKQARNNLASTKSSLHNNQEA